MVAALAVVDQCRPSAHRVSDIASWVLSGAVAIAGLLPQLRFFVSHIASAHESQNNFLHFQPLFGSVEEFIRRWWWGLGPTMFLFMVAIGVECFKCLKGLSSTASTSAATASRKKDGADHGNGGPERVVEPTTYVSRHTDGLRRRGANQEDKVPQRVLQEGAKGAEEASAAASTTPGYNPVRFAVLLGCIGTFIVGYGIRFQPWDRDNIKLLYLSLLLGLVYVSGLLVDPLRWCFRRGSYVLGMLYIPFVVVIVVAMSFSGYISLWREDNMRHELISAGEKTVSSPCCSN